jgi:adenylyltransferase/sulfurtransferase
VATTSIFIQLCNKKQGIVKQVSARDPAGIQPFFTTLMTELDSSDVLLPAGLTASAVSRYSRQMLVADIGASGQIALSQAAVLVVGAGGLGCGVIPSLAGAGIAKLGIIDPDVVEASNLHRQTMHRQVDCAGTNKAESAARFVRELNSAVSCEVYSMKLDESNALELVREYDVIIDASDNPRTRYILNDACVLVGRVLVSGSAIGLEGQLTVYHYKGGPCYRCVYPNPGVAPSCSDSGVVGPVPAVIGNLQALEALKIIAGFGEVLSGTLLM